MKTASNRKRRTWGLATVAALMIAGGVVMIVGGIVYARSGHAAHVQESLTSTSAAPSAAGRARLNLRGSRHGRFVVAARKLSASKTYDLIVGGVKVGVVQTKSNGSGHARFSTNPRSTDSLLGFDPQGQQVIVRDEEDGEDVLVGDIPDDDPSAVACCVADGGDGETECEDLTADECAAAGGTVQAVASCLPDPCSTAPVEGEDIICCTNQTHDDESEAECEDVSTEAECAAAGGTVVTGTSCDANPCAATPPATVTTCCIPDESDPTGPSECEVLSPEACTAAGGTAASGSSCTPDPCNP